MCFDCFYWTLPWTYMHIHNDQWENLLLTQMLLFLTKAKLKVQAHTAVNIINLKKDMQTNLSTYTVSVMHSSNNNKKKIWVFLYFDSVLWLVMLRLSYHTPTACHLGRHNVLWSTEHSSRRKEQMFPDLPRVIAHLEPRAGYLPQHPLYSGVNLVHAE